MNRAETLEQLARLCRRLDIGAAAAASPTGFSELDKALPAGGWQCGTVVELMPEQTGIGEFRLLAPTLTRITRERYALLVAPPFIPFAPALRKHGVVLDRLIIIEAKTSEDVLWATEQALRCKSFGAVVAWPASVRDREVRRLQLAAEAGGSIGFLYRSPSAARESSPAAMRLRLRSGAEGLQIDVLKCRGGRSGFQTSIDPSSADWESFESTDGASALPADHLQPTA